MILYQFDLVLVQRFFIKLIVSYILLLKLWTFKIGRTYLYFQERWWRHFSCNICCVIVALWMYFLWMLIFTPYTVWTRYSKFTLWTEITNGWTLMKTWIHSCVPLKTNCSGKAFAGRTGNKNTECFQVYGSSCGLLVLWRSMTILSIMTKLGWPKRSFFNALYIFSSD